MYCSRLWVVHVAVGMSRGGYSRSVTLWAVLPASSVTLRKSFNLSELVSLIYLAGVLSAISVPLGPEINKTDKEFIL